MLARALAASPYIHAMHATKAPEDEGQHVQSVVPTAAAHGGPGTFAFDVAAHLTERSALGGPGAAQAIWARWIAFWPRRIGPSDVLLEKSPPTIVRTRFFQHLFPRARFVVILRHPAIVAASTHCWRPELAADTLVRHWLVAHDRYRGDRDRLLCRHEVRYEELVAEPWAGLSRLGNALGLPGNLDPSAIQPGHTRPHVATWRAMRSRCDPSVWPGLEGRLHRYGYSLDEPYVLPVQ